MHGTSLSHFLMPQSNGAGTTPAAGDLGGTELTAADEFAALMNADPAASTKIGTDAVREEATKEEPISEEDVPPEVTPAPIVIRLDSPPPLPAWTALPPEAAPPNLDTPLVEPSSIGATAPQAAPLLNPGFSLPGIIQPEQPIASLPAPDAMTPVATPDPLSLAVAGPRPSTFIPISAPIEAAPMLDAGHPAQTAAQRPTPAKTPQSRPTNDEMAARPSTLPAQIPSTEPVPMQAFIPQNIPRNPDATANQAAPAPQAPTATRVNSRLEQPVSMTKPSPAPILASNQATPGTNPEASENPNVVKVAEFLPSTDAPNQPVSAAPTPIGTAPIGIVRIDTSQLDSVPTDAAPPKAAPTETLPADTTSKQSSPLRGMVDLPPAPPTDSPSQPQSSTLIQPRQPAAGPMAPLTPILAATIADPVAPSVAPHPPAPDAPLPSSAPLNPEPHTNWSVQPPMPKPADLPRNDPAKAVFLQRVQDQAIQTDQSVQTVDPEPAKIAVPAPSPPVVAAPAPAPWPTAPEIAGPKVEPAKPAQPPEQTPLQLNDAPPSPLGPETPLPKTQAAAAKPDLAPVPPVRLWQPLVTNPTNGRASAPSDLPAPTARDAAGPPPKVTPADPALRRRIESADLEPVTTRPLSPKPTQPSLPAPTAPSVEAPRNPAPVISETMPPARPQPTASVATPVSSAPPTAPIGVETQPKRVTTQPAPTVQIRPLPSVTSVAKSVSISAPAAPQTLLPLTEAALSTLSPPPMTKPSRHSSGPAPKGPSPKPTLSATMPANLSDQARIQPDQPADRATSTRRRPDDKMPEPAPNLTAPPTPPTSHQPPTSEPARQGPAVEATPVPALVEGQGPAPSSAAPGHAHHANPHAPAVQSISAGPSLPAPVMPLPAHGLTELPHGLSVSLVKAASRADKDDQVEVLLNPVELGRVRFELLTQGEKVQVVLSVERPETLDLLRRHADALRAEFHSAGFDGASLNFSGWNNSRQGHEPQPGPHPDFGPAEVMNLAPSLPPARPLNIAQGAGLDMRL